MLHALLATSSPPAPLRLFVSSAISSERYQSLSVFAEALAYYEASGRHQLIQSAYRRWATTRAEGVSSAAIPLRPEPEQEKKPVSSRNATARRLPRWAVATAAVAVVFAGGTGAWLAAGARPLSIPSVSFSVPAPIQEALRRLGVTAPGEVATAGPDTSDAASPRVAKPKGSTPRARVRDADPNPTTVSELTDTAAASDPVTTAADGLTSTPGIVNDPAARGTAGSPGAVAFDETRGTPDNVETVADSIVYSGAFPEVVPPVMTTRQIAAPQALTPGIEAPNTIELVVDQSGRVERVRLISRPSPMLAMMLLSAAKTWKFTPALNDGRPVKYRLQLDVVMTQP
jgi:hypothetical protein